MTKWTQEKRDELPSSDFGDPENKKYPIADCNDVKDAWNLAGKADNPENVRKRIKSIAKRKGLEKCLPASAKGEKLVDSRYALIESFEWNESQDSAVIQILGITADHINKNKRVYKREVLREAVNELAENIKTTSAKSGRRLITGELDHPTSKGNKQELLSESVILWNLAEWNEELGGPVLTGETTPTSKGIEFAKLARFLFERGMPIPISQRGYGSADIQVIDGQKVEVIEDLKITGYDFVIEQSDINAGVLTLESDDEYEDIMDIQETVETQEVQNGQQETTQENKDGSQEAAQENAQEVLVEDTSVLIAKALAEKEAEYTEALSQKELAMTGLVNQLSELERQMQWIEADKAQVASRQAMASWLKDQISALPENYPSEVKTNLEQIQAESLENLQALWESKITEYQPIVSTLIETAKIQDEANKFMDGQTKAQDELKSEGFGRIEGVKNVWEERVQGVTLNINESLMQEMPKMLHVMDKITESKGGMSSFDFSKPAKTASQKLAVEMFERFLTNHETQIIAGANEWDNLNKRRSEARARGATFDETPTLRSAYNLPYLVMAGIVPEVYASLVSPEVFTVMPLKNETQRYYVEAWGATPTASVSDEVVTSDENAWVALAHPFVVKSSLNVTNSAGTTGFVMFRDYVVDTETGRLWTVSGANSGTIGDSVSLKVDYTYQLLAEGENAPIEFVATSSSYATLVATAKRLGFNLSDEAVKFAASDLGYDTRGSHLQTATYRMAQELDRKMFEVAEAYAYAGNMKTTGWTKTPGSGVSIDDNLRLLVDRIAEGIDKIQQYFYVPTHIVMAQSLAHKFHRTDLLDMDVQRQGVALDSNLIAGKLHNLPVYAVPYGQFADQSVLILAGKDVVVKGVYSPLEIVGGEGFINRATTGDTNRLVAARAWYLQEYYDLVVPVDPTDSNLTRKIAVVPVS